MSGQPAVEREMTVKEVIIAILVLSWSVQAGASTLWINSVQVEEVLLQSKGGYQAVTVRYSGGDATMPICAPTEQHRIVSFWTGGDFSAFVQGWLSLLLSAQAQRLTVDLAVDSGNCNTAALWGAFGSPEGLGYRLEAVRIKAD